MVTTRTKAISNIKLDGVHYGDYEFDPEPFNQLIDKACQELYGPEWAERLKFKEEI